ncbi:MAG TPA: carboxypeptidase regulatory-like domain-containing protein [Polyangia bacterium]|nr:carboxypeptidase regulatory-like domain-containing protein [Polyangia bacterium]
MGWLLAVLALLGAGAGFFIMRARRHRAPDTTTSARAPERGRAAPALWAADPDAPRGAIEGIVRAPDGKPYQGALVAAVPAAPDRERPKPAAVALSTGGGRFRLENLPAGPYAATATAPGFAPAFKGELTLLPGETLRGVELLLGKEGITIRGHVYDSGGGAIAGAQVRAARHSKDEGDIFQVAADAQGAYAITLARGNYTFTADAEGYAPEERFVSVKGEETVDFKLNPAATLRGRVVMRGRGEPVPGATVRLTPERGWWEEKQAQTDAQGVFELKDLDPGAYQLSARKGALVGHLSRTVEVTLGGFLGDVTIEVDRGRTISGQVRTKNGAPVAEAKLRLGEGSWGGFGGRVRATSGPSGSYQIEGLLPGKYAVHAHKAGFAPARKENLVVADRDLEHVDLELSEGAEVSGKVVGKDGQGIAGAAVWGFVSSGGGVWGASSSASDRSGADGSFKLKDLGAGQLHLHAEHPDRGHATLDPIALGAGEKKQVTISIEDGGSIAGTVKWDDGTPAGGVNVSAVARGQERATAKAAADGTYKLTPLGKGTFLVGASRTGSGDLFMMPGGGGSEPKLVNLGANEHKTGVDMTLQRGGHRISGIVLGPDGKPVENAGVSADQENESGASVRVRALGLTGGRGKVFTQADGSFTIDDLAAGKYTVWAAHAGFPNAELDHVPADSTGVRVQFKPEAVVAGVVVGGGGKPVADYALTVMPSQPSVQSRVAAFMGGSAQQQVHDPSGAFEVHSLQAGTYDLVVTATDGHAGKLGGVTLADGEQKRNLRIQIGQGVTLKGRVVEWGSGRPIADAHLIAGATGQPVLANADAQGSFQLEGLPPGRPVQIVASQDVPMLGGSKVLMDTREINIPDGKDTWDAGTIKLVQGDISLLMSAPGSTGMSAINRDGRAYVDRIVPNSPAAKAGLKPGDALMTVDGRDVSDLGPTAIGLWTLGAVGTQVVIGYGPAGGGAVRQVTLTRDPRPRGGGM